MKQLRKWAEEKSKNHSFLFLNITQSFGVINDNIFKLVMAFLLIESLGYSHTSSILSATGAIYVIPFLLFSSSAGIIADRFSKQRLLVVMKAAEVLLMFLALFAFGAKSLWGCYTLLFFVSTHSALFGPSKYGIISELVPPENISKANGAVTGITYLSIILGTFLASFLTEVTDRRFVLIALFCLVLAALGLCSALCMRRTEPQGSTKKVSFFFVREIFYTLRYCRTVPHLLPAIFGSAYFLFIGGFTQLNIIPFTIQSLNKSEVVGGYLFLATALGIALGSFLAGKASKKRAELGLSCMAGLGIALFLLLLSVFSTSLTKVIICLVGIGVLGGAFIVPFDTCIQLTSQNEKRGQTIAAANFLSFLGVLIASFLLYFFSQVLDLSAAQGFAVIGCVTLLVTSVFIFSLSELFFYYFSRKILKPLYRYRHPPIEEIDQTKNAILVMENFSWKKALLLAASLQNIAFLIPKKSSKWHSFFRLFSSLHPVEGEALFKEAERFLEKDQIPCLLLEKTLPPQTAETQSKFFAFFKRSKHSLVFAHLHEDESKKRRTFSFSKKES